MKKTIKTIKKTNSLVKKKKSSSRKRSKKGHSDTFKAFILVAVLIGIAALISYVLINNRNSHEIESEITEEAPEVKPAPKSSEPEKPVIAVTVEKPPAPPARPAPQPPTPAPAANTTSSAAAATTRNMQKPVENLGTLVFVIDDAGNNLRELEPFLKIPGPITIAVLPGLAYSAEAARRIRAAGKEVILHQPMEALGGQNPGPGAIYSGMSASEIRSVLAKNIAEVGPVVGMNNHQGSKVTMDREMMETILSFCAENGLFFLDSRTTAETAAPAAARRLGMKIAERDVFIDNEQDTDSMLRFIASGLTRAQRNGHAIMIGHAWSPQLAALLTEQYLLLTIQGYSIRTVSDVLKL